jgi:heme-degrading monooxygenase HmoA
VRLREMDERTTYMQQLRGDTGPVVLINQFNVAPEDAERFLEVWADDAAFMKQQPGFISTQLHRGTAGSTTFINTAVWSRQEHSARRSHRPSSKSAPRATPTAPLRHHTSSRRSPSQESASPRRALRRMHSQTRGHAS